MTDSQSQNSSPRPAILERATLARLPWVALLGVLALFLAACSGGDGDRVALDTKQVDLKEVNDSGFTGEVLLTSVGDNRTVVVVGLGRNGTAEGDFPAAIHEGTCPGLAGNEVFALEPLRSGFLSQEISASMDVLGERDHALIVFQSGERSVYIACADLP